MNVIKKVSYAVAAIAMASPLAALAAGTGGFNSTTPGGVATGLPSGTISSILLALFNWLLWAIGIIAVIGFIIAGILYITAAGDEGQIDKAKSAMLYCIIGVIVALLGIVIMRAASTFLGGGSSF